MKSGWWIGTSTVILLAVLGPQAEAGRSLHDQSGAMQSYDSRMTSSAIRSTPRDSYRMPRDFSGSAMQRQGSRMTSSAMRSAPRDFSGDTLQSHSSRMISSPVTPFVGQLGTTFSTYLVYPAPQSTPSVKAQIQAPDVGTTPSPTSPARPKFWTARCGKFVALEASSTMNLMEEERKPCTR